MATNKNTIQVYRDWKEIFQFLSDEDAGKLIKHFFEYVNDNNPEEPTGFVGLAWVTIKSQLKRDLKKWEAVCDRNRENGAKGGRPKAHKIRDEKPTGLSGLKNKPKKADKDKDKDILNIYIPTYDEFLNYALSKKGNINFSHDALRLKYESWKVNDWKDGNDKKIKNWKTKILNSLPYLKERKQIHRI